MVDCNATQAAIRAGYSARTANEQAARLLANVSIKAYIDEKMEQLHILVDVSHLSEAGFWDVAEMAARPFIASHSNAKSVWDHTRNLTDGQINAIIKNQGVIGLNFYTGFVGGSQNLDMVRAHLDRILELGGAKNATLGGDWDGCDTIPSLPAIDSLPRLYEHLLRHGYAETVVQDLFYNNLMRVVR